MQTPATSPVPDFTDVVQAVLELIGIGPPFIAVVLLAFALESWYSNARRLIKTATVVGDTLGRSGIWLARQRPVRIIAAVVSTVTALTAQVLMVRMSYLGGSIVATPFDPVRRAAFNDAYGSSPLLFVDAGFLAQFLKVDAISVIYVLATLMLIVFAYRPKAIPSILWMLMTTPYWLLLFGSAGLAIIAVAFNLLFAGLSVITGAAVDWTLIQDYVLAAPHLAVDLLAGIYCLLALVSIASARIVRRLWTLTEHGPTTDTSK